jgi:hypothetical protein
MGLAGRGFVATETRRSGEIESSVDDFAGQLPVRVLLNQLTPIDRSLS